MDSRGVDRGWNAHAGVAVDLAFAVSRRAGVAGIYFLLEPINVYLGGESLFGCDASGDPVRITNLMLSGFLCGVLWEFWNYWSAAKWHYTVPIMEHVKIFEMPLPGYFGFPAFALECFTMYVFVRTLGARALGLLSHRGHVGHLQLGRPIAL